MTPVGNTIIPPDPTKGVNTFSGILGLKQQQQQLQIGAQTLQQEQLKTGQQQGVQDFFQSWDPTEHIADDGTTDLDSALQSPQFKSAGNAKPAIMQALLDVKQKQLGNKQALSSLNKDLVTQFGTAMGSLATDEDVKTDKTDPTTGVNAGRAKVNEFLTNFSKLSPDAARVAQIYAPITQKAPPGKLSHGIAALQLQAQSASEQQAQQNPVPGSITAGTHQFPTVTPRATGVPQLTGQAFDVPSQVVSTPAGPLGVASPSKGTVSPLTTAPPAGQAPGPNVNATRAQVETQTGLARGITDRVSMALSQANNTIQAQDALTRAKSILESAGSPNTGAAFEKLKGLKNLLASLGVDTQNATDTNSLVKNLARYEGARATAAGLGATDAARELAHNGSPNTQIDKGALIGIVNQSLATEKALAAYAAKQSKAGSDPDKLIQNENAFRSIPNLIEGYEYGMSRTPQEANDFLGKHGISPAEMKRTRALIKQFESQ
jgi:hypothetical protein